MIASLRQATVVEAWLKIEVTSRIYRLPSSLPPFVYVSRPRSSASISTSFLVATLAAITLLAQSSAGNVQTSSTHLSIAPLRYQRLAPVLEALCAATHGKLGHCVHTIIARTCILFFNDNSSCSLSFLARFLLKNESVELLIEKFFPWEESVSITFQDEEKIADGFVGDSRRGRISK